MVAGDAIWLRPEEDYINVHSIGERLYRVEAIRKKPVSDLVTPADLAAQMAKVSVEEQPEERDVETESEIVVTQPEKNALCLVALFGTVVRRAAQVGGPGDEPIISELAVWAAVILYVFYLVTK